MKDRLKLMEENVAKLYEFKAKHSFENLQNNKELEWALRYGLIESIQMVIDISCHLASKQNLGTPKTYSECIDLLAKFGYLSEELTSKIKSMIGLRNILIHEYISVDIRRLYDLLEELDDVREFVRSVKDYI